MADEALSIQIEPLRGLGGRMKRLSEATRQETAVAIQQAAIIAEATARRGAPRDTGALARSITSEVKGLSARVFSTRDYATYVELGRSPGARMPPPAALEGWVRRHFGASPERARGLAFVLARAIARRGIPGRFFMRAAARKVTEQMPNLLAQAAARVEKVWSAER